MPYWITSCGDLGSSDFSSFGGEGPDGSDGSHKTYNTYKTYPLSPKGRRPVGRASMGFVQASMLAALAAVILPVLAHLLFDRSASMARQLDGERLIDHAVRELPEVIARIPARSRVEVAWFDMKAEPIGSSEDGRVSLASLEAPSALTG